MVSKEYENIRFFFDINAPTQEVFGMEFRKMNPEDYARHPNAGPKAYIHLGKLSIFILEPYGSEIDHRTRIVELIQDEDNSANGIRIWPLDKERSW